MLLIIDRLASLLSGSRARPGKRHEQNCVLLYSGTGAVRLADAVLRAVEEPVEFKFLYDVKVSYVGSLNY